MQSEHLPRIASAFPCFASVSLEDWSRSGASILTVPAQIVIEEGHIFEHASFLLTGCIRIYKISPTGKELTLYRLRSGETCVIMIASILGEMRYEAIAEAEEESELLVLPVRVFKQWMSTFPELNLFIYRLFVRRMVSVTGRIEEMTFQSMEQRVADWLLRQASPNSSMAPLYVTHEAISMELGTAREVVSRVLKRFEKLGLVHLGRGKIHLHKRSELEKLLHLPE